MATTTAKLKIGRPSHRSSELLDAICDRLASGESLVSICSDEANPSYTTVRRWLQEDEDFQRNYVRAREDQAEYFAEQIIGIADKEADPQKARNMIDARKWTASKLLPKKYGDKPAEFHAHQTTNNFLIVTEAERLDMIEQRKRLQNGDDS